MSTSNIEKADLFIEGMTCGSCVYKIEREIKKLKGITEASVTLLLNRGSFKYDSQSGLSIKDIINRINELGFKASLLSNESKPSCTKLDMDLETCVIQISGMTNIKCINTIQDNLLKEAGIVSVNVSLLKEKADIKYNPEYLIPSQIATMISNIGFGARLLDLEKEKQNNIEHVELFIEGMTCASCVYKVEREIKKLKGITEVSVTLLTNRGSFKYDSQSKLGVRDIINRINELGFKASLLNNESKSSTLASSHRKAIRRWRNSFILSLVFGTPSMIAMFVFMYLIPTYEKNHTSQVILAFELSIKRNS